MTTLTLSINDVSPTLLTVMKEMVWLPAVICTDGVVIVVTGPKNRVVGAHILAPAAGEMIHLLTFLIKKKLAFNELASMVHVYPTLSTSIGQLAAEVAFEGAKKFRWVTRLARA